MTDLGRGFYSEVHLTRLERKKRASRSSRGSLDADGGGGVDVAELFALKVVDRQRCSERDLSNEIMVMHSISHPFHIKLLNAYRSPSRLYMLLEYAPHNSVKSHIDYGEHHHHSAWLILYGHSSL